MKNPVRYVTLAALTAIAALLLAACGSDDPTATSQPTNTPAPEATPTATLLPGVPTPTPVPATPTPAPTPTPAFDGAAYFAGETVKMITGTSPGGGYDTMLRIFGKVAPKYFPDTRFVVQNLPGAGQLRGLQAVMAADPDGYTIGPTHQRWFIQQALFGDVDGLDFATVDVIGSPTFKPNPNMLCVDSDVATSWQDVIDKGITLKTGQTAPGNSPGAEFVELIGGPIENVYGYGGSAEVMAAFDRGEINMVWGCGPELAGRLFPEWNEEGRLAPLYWWEMQQPDEWMAKIGVPNSDVPHIFDIPGVDWTDLNKQAFSSWVEIATISRTFLLPPGVDKDVGDYWRSQFKAIVEDPDFIESAFIAGYGDSYGYAGGVEIKKSLLNLDKLPDNVKEILKGISPSQ
jgi:tripartite-type tricarboxylate transporter receptor subunit TctC